MRCFLVSQAKDGNVAADLIACAADQLPAGAVTIRVHYSSLNYKDALASQGHAGVVRRFPHVPGIDAAGVVTQSDSTEFHAGEPVLVTGFGLGSDVWGGYAEYIRVPAEWIVKLPAGMTLRETMAYGTAGMTAAICIEALLARGVAPGSGEIIVTGASGGVGSLAVGILARLGFSVAAVSGKPAAHDLLSRLGAQRILSREEAVDSSPRPLLKGVWGAAVDTVGGAMLSTILRSLKYGGAATACGLVGGAELPLTVYPFILRGVQLIGIDSGFYPIAKRPALWSRLANDWKPAVFNELAAAEITLAELPDKIAAILRGEVIGRTVVRLIE